MRAGGGRLEQRDMECGVDLKRGRQLQSYSSRIYDFLYFKGANIMRCQITGLYLREVMGREPDLLSSLIGQGRGSTMVSHALVLVT